VDPEPITYNPMTPGYFADPYPHYAQLREQNPAHVTKFGFLMLSSHQYVLEAYDNPLLSRDTRHWDGFVEWRRGSADGILEQMMANWLVMIDPPRHTLLRDLHDQVFTAGRMAQATGAIETIVADLLAQPIQDGGMDLVAQFADRLPVYLINHLLDLPRSDWDQFVAWSRAIALTSEPTLTTKVLQAGREALQGMYDYLSPLVESRRSAPGDDVLSGLSAGAVHGRRMDHQEILDSITFLYQAGHPTTTQLIALGTHTLLRHPDQWERLCADRSLIVKAVEEMQRYDGPVQMNDRVAMQDLEVCGVVLQRGQLVRLCLGAANRDPARYAEPDRFDIDRSPVEHLGYGHGLHYCVAAALGRAQARVALNALLENAPKLRLTGAKLRYLPSVSNRGLMLLPVEF
jgi:cytochrome P450